MQEIKPGVPDIIEPLTAAMERLAIAPRMIADFRQLWRQLKPHSQILPCPLCFSIGYIGKLVELPANKFGNESVRCETCDAQIVVHRVN